MVTVRLLGARGGCTMATMTLQSVIKRECSAGPQARAPII
ncbi:MAG: NifU family protein [Desulfobacteraceae bacterium]|nr:MAG: NifU family protein [Desulfobacteraceae bacterium]